MSFRGSLDSFNLADILQNIAMNKTTGGLRLYDDKGEKCVYFREGEVAFMTVAGGRLVRLAEMLVGQGIATPEDVKLARLKQAKSKGSFAEAVVEAELMSADDLGLLIHSRVEEEIYSLFHWAHAEFEFDEGAPVPYNADADQGWVQVRFNTSSLIMEAARRIDELERMRQKVPSVREVFVAAAGPAPDEDSSPIEGRMLFLLDGSRDVEDVAQETFFSSYEITRALCNFLDRGLVQVAEVELLRQRVREVKESGDLRRVVKLYERILSMGSEDIEARKALAEAAAQARDHDKAAIHFSVLAEEALRAGDREDEAVAIYKRILSLIPKHPASHEKLASIYVSRGWRSEAVKHYQALVQARTEAGRLEEARLACLKAVEVDPDSPDTRSMLARIYLAMKDPKHALEQLVFLGDSYVKLGRSRPAAEAYKRALQIDKGASRVKKKLAEVTTSGSVLRLKKALAVSFVSLLMALFLVAGVAGVREFFSHRNYAVADARAQALTGEHKYDEAIALYKPFLATRWSLTGVPQRAKQKVEEIEMLMKSTQKSAAHEARKRSVALLERALESWKKRDYAGSGQVARQALASGALEEVEREQMRALIGLSKDEDEAETSLRDWTDNEADFESEDAIRTQHGKVRKFAATWRTRIDDFVREYGLDIKPEDYPSTRFLQSLTLHIKIDCEVPTGAEVFVNGERKGTTPLVISYPPGSPPSLVLRKEGFVERKVPRGELGPVVRVWLAREHAWNRRLRGGVSAPPACWDGTVIVGTLAGSVHAVDVRTGRRSWTNYASDEALHGILTRVLRTETCYVFAGGNVHGFGIERPSTKEAFTIECGSPVLGDIAASRLHIWSERYVGIAASRRELVAFEATKGAELWREDVNVFLTSPPELTQAMIYVGGEDRTIHAVYGFGVGKGKLQKRWHMRGVVEARPLVFGNDLFAADASGRVCCLDAEAESARPRWTFSAGAPVTREMFLDGERGALYFSSDDGKLWALSMKTGARLWKSPFQGEGRPVGPPQPGKGRVYFATVKALYALDSSDASLVWKFEPPDGVSGGLCFDEGRLFVGSRSGRVYCFEEFDG